MVRTFDAGRHAAGPRRGAGTRDGAGIRVRSAEHVKMDEKERSGKKYMSFRTVAALLLLLAVMTASLIYYIRIQAEVTRTTGVLADLEQELAQKRAENDAEYNEINDRISLDEIRDKAINELGMKYADRNQVVIYSGSEKDTVKKVDGSGK